MQKLAYLCGIAFLIRVCSALSFQNVAFYGFPFSRYQQPTRLSQGRKTQIIQPIFKDFLKRLDSVNRRVNNETVNSSWIKQNIQDLNLIYSGIHTIDSKTKAFYQTQKAENIIELKFLAELKTLYSRFFLKPLGMCSF